MASIAFGSQGIDTAVSGQCREVELGPHHVSCEMGCHLFSILPSFNIGATTMGYGLPSTAMYFASSCAPDAIPSTPRS